MTEAEAIFWAFTSLGLAIIVFFWGLFHLKHLIKGEQDNG